MLILSGDGDEITLKMDLMTMNSFVKHEASKSDDSWSPQYRCCYAAPQTIFFLGYPCSTQRPTQDYFQPPRTFSLNLFLPDPQQSYPPEPSIGNWVYVTHAK